MKDKKILVTGATGLVGGQIARYLARDNEVWGLARFGGSAEDAAAKRRQLNDIGIKPIACDLANPDFSVVPDDFTYVLHLSHTRRGPQEFVESIQVNAIGTGLLLQHCRKAKAALVVSSTAVYSPPQDVFTPLAENGDIGRAWAPWAPSSPVSKVSLEAVSRFAAEAFHLPTTIMRLNTCYGPAGGMPVTNMDAIVNGQAVGTFADPYPHSPIHFDDMCLQLDALLDAATAPANIVNWCGDEVVTQRQWCEYIAEFSGREFELKVNAIPGTPNGNVGDHRKRLSITGPCKHKFKTSLREIFDKRYV